MCVCECDYVHVQMSVTVSVSMCVCVCAWAGVSMSVCLCVVSLRFAELLFVCVCVVCVCLYVSCVSVSLRLCVCVRLVFVHVCRRLYLGQSFFDGIQLGDGLQENQKRKPTTLDGIPWKKKNILKFVCVCVLCLSGSMEPAELQPNAHDDPWHQLKRPMSTSNFWSSQTGLKHWIY